MAVILGRNSRIKKNSVTIAKMTSMSITIGDETIDITSFGDNWAKFAIGMRNWTASISGFYVKDNTEQNALRTANIGGTSITDLTFYIDSTSFYDIDTVSDTESACVIDTFTVTSDNNAVVAFDMTVTGTGVLAYNAS